MLKPNVLDPSDSDARVRPPQPSARMLRAARIVVLYEMNANLKEANMARPKREDLGALRDKIASKAVELASMKPDQLEELLRTVAPADVVEQLLPQVN